MKTARRKRQRLLNRPASTLKADYTNSDRFWPRCHPPSNVIGDSYRETEPRTRTSRDSYSSRLACRNFPAISGLADVCHLCRDTSAPRRSMAMTKRTAAADLITFLPPALCEGQSARTSLFVTHKHPHFFFSEQNTFCCCSADWQPATTCDDCR